MSGEIYQKIDGRFVKMTPRIAAVSARNVGELVHSLVPLDDAGLHLLDGSLLPADGIYAAGTAKIAALQTDCPGLFVTEADWQASAATYGVCGKFVYDATAGTLRLPRVTGFIEATIDATALGDLVEAGLPNAIGQLTEIHSGVNGVAATGAFARSQRVTFSAGNSGATNASNVVDFSLASSNHVYGNSTTVQPQFIKGFVYIALANEVKTTVQVDIDNVVTDINNITTAINGKADISLTSVNATCQAAMAHAALPSYQFIELPWPAHGGTLTAQADGWIATGKVAGTAGGNLGLFLHDPDKPVGNIHRLISSRAFGYAATDLIFVCVPVVRGAIVSFSYTTSGTKDPLRFIYSNGSAPA